jgi:hypothetical protein
MHYMVEHVDGAVRLYQRVGIDQEWRRVERFDLDGLTGDLESLVELLWQITGNKAEVRRDGALYFRSDIGRGLPCPVKIRLRPGARTTIHLFVDTGRWNDEPHAKGAVDDLPEKSVRPLIELLKVAIGTRTVSEAGFHPAPDVIFYGSC